ncbi:MAG TPA: GNAT family N-acetyltransferase [Microvirga sp.]
MNKPTDENIEVVRRLYRGQAFFFPLIAAVLDGTQDGLIFIDNTELPTEAYVEHASGFAQIFGATSLQFERALERYLITDRPFAVPKVRLYARVGPRFLTSDVLREFRAERQRFRLQLSCKRAVLEGSTEGHIQTLPVVPHLMDAIERRFGLATRFWRSAEDFAAQSRGIVVLEGGEVVALCYAAALADDKAEIDVVTSEDCRGSGFGRLAAGRFIDQCVDAGVEPLWDCFTNNLPSMKTARALGFKPEGPAYPLFTIPRGSALAP